MNFFTLKDERGRNRKYEILHAFRRNNEQFMIYKECCKTKKKPLYSKYNVINNRLVIFPVIDEEDIAMVCEEMDRVLA